MANNRWFSLQSFVFIATLASCIPAARLYGQANTDAAQGGAEEKSVTPRQPGQLPPSEEPGVRAPGKTKQGEDKRAFGVLPNYRTAEMSAEFHPIEPKRKLTIALKDSFDYPILFAGTIYAGLYQLSDSHPEFGQGMAGYMRRLGTSYADQVDGNFMTEGLMPIVFREDPRYFRIAEGSVGRRTWYAISRIVVTRTDAGGSSFNFAEVVGNGVAAGIGLSYYPDSRDFGSYMQNLGTQLAGDAASQVLKEFWPDVKRRWYEKHHKGELADDK